MLQGSKRNLRLNIVERPFIRMQISLNMLSTINFRVLCTPKRQKKDNTIFLKTHFQHTDILIVPLSSVRKNGKIAKHIHLLKLPPCHPPTGLDRISSQARPIEPRYIGLSSSCSSHLYGVYKRL